MRIHKVYSLITFQLFYLTVRPHNSIDLNYFEFVIIEFLVENMISYTSLCKLITLQEGKSFIVSFGHSYNENKLT